MDELGVVSAFHQRYGLEDVEISVRSSYGAPSIPTTLGGLWQQQQQPQYGNSAGSGGPNVMGDDPSLLYTDGLTQVYEESPRASESSVLASADAHSVALQLADQLNLNFGSESFEETSSQEHMWKKGATIRSSTTTQQRNTTMNGNSTSYWIPSQNRYKDLSDFFVSKQQPEILQRSRAVVVIGVQSVPLQNIVEACARAGALTTANDEFHLSRGLVFLMYADLRDASRALRIASNALRTMSSEASIRRVAFVPLSSKDSVRDGLLKDTRTVVITGLPAHTKECDLDAVFKQNSYGDIENMRKLLSSGYSQKSTSNFSITFYSRLDAERAIEELDRHDDDLGQEQQQSVFFQSPDETHVENFRDFLALLDSWREESDQVRRSKQRSTVVPNSTSAKGHRAFVSMLNSVASARAAEGDTSTVRSPFPTPLQEQNTIAKSTTTTNYRGNRIHSFTAGSTDYTTASDRQQQTYGIVEQQAHFDAYSVGTFNENSYKDGEDMRRGTRTGFSDAASLNMTPANTVSAHERDAFRLVNSHHAGGYDDYLGAQSRNTGRLYASAEPWSGSYESSSSLGNQQQSPPSSTSLRPTSPPPLVLRPLSDDGSSNNGGYSMMTTTDDHLRLSGSTLAARRANTKASMTRASNAIPRAGGASISPGFAATQAYAYTKEPTQHMGLANSHNFMGPHPGGGGGASPILNADFAFDVDRVASGTDQRTTLMVRNIPNKYTQQAVLDEFNVRFKGCYDFFYLPIDFKNKCNVGYAFINLIEPRDVTRFYREFNGRRWSCFRSGKVCAITYARIQGRQSMITRFQNSSLLNEVMEVQPRLFYSAGPHKGEPEPFPGTQVPLISGNNVMSASTAVRTEQTLHQHHPSEYQQNSHQQNISSRVQYSSAYTPHTQEQYHNGTVSPLEDQLSAAVLEGRPDSNISLHQHYNSTKYSAGGIPVNNSALHAPPPPPLPAGGSSSPGKNRPSRSSSF